MGLLVLLNLSPDLGLAQHCLDVLEGDEAVIVRVEDLWPIRSDPKIGLQRKKPGGSVTMIIARDVADFFGGRGYRVDLISGPRVMKTLRRHLTCDVCMLYLHRF